MRIVTFILLAVLSVSTALLFTACDDDTAVVDTTNISIRFSHNFDDDMVDNSTFNAFNYINANGDTLSITRLRYLISDIVLTLAGGDQFTLEGYQLVDVTAGTGFVLQVAGSIPQGTYAGLSFTFGFDEEDNIEDAYPDLNVVNWNWPDMLGGGYHFMQMEGNYMEDGVAMPYAYHYGTARVMEGVFEANHFEAALGGFTLDRQTAEIEIEMDIAEWYRNPNTWDLGIYHIMLMPNYDAQKLMQANGATVFSLGDITQAD
jgi:hypothetical protein